MDKILFAWDFHGVLEKGNDIAFSKLFLKCYESLNLSKDISEEDILQHYGLKFSDIIQKVIPDADYNIINHFFNYFNKDNFAHVRKYMREREEASYVLGRIKDAGHDNVVISSASQESIDRFVDVIDLRNYFEKIIGIGNYYSEKATKSYFLRLLGSLSRYSKLIMIGDHCNDMFEGKKLDAKTYLFSENGKSCPDADNVINRLYDVLKEILY